MPFKKAMEELDRLAKSGKTEDELEALAKALETELGIGEGELHKSAEDITAEAEEAERLRKAQEEADVQAEADAEAERLRKAQETEDEDELVKASEAYADLQKSVEEGTNSTLAEIDVLKKSVGALLNLNIKLAGVVSDLAKSRKEEMDDLKKSLGALGAAPVAPNAARLGVGSAEGEEGELKKSNSEIQDSLIKAINDGKVAAHYLSDFGTYKDVNRLPQEVRDIIEA